MDIFSVITLLGGLALFLYGMNTLGAGLEKLSGGTLERTLEKLTSNPFKGVLLGAGVTAVIQSSSATTVMVVGFVNSGIMKLNQAVGIIMGANIGTTVTSWILSLTGIESSNVFIKLLNPSSFSPVLALVGIIMIMVCKNGKKRDIGTILIGFAILMFGMNSMSSAVKPLAEMPEFRNILLLFTNPLLGVLAGALLTAIIQSSSASVGILQALSSTGAITYSFAIPVIMGQNIGTCVTALISCIGANKNAKRAAMIHLYFNIIGTLLFLALFYGANALFDFAFVNSTIDAAGIAVVHSVFNVFATAVLLPFSGLLCKLASLTVRDKADEGEKDAQLLDERFLNTPSFALEQCRSLTVSMARSAELALNEAISLMAKYSEADFDEVKRLENRTDMLEDRLGTYLVKLSSRELTEKDSLEISKLLHSISDFERIGDHAVNIAGLAKELRAKGISFSKEATEELDRLLSAIIEIIGKAADSFENNDVETAISVEPLEQVIDDLIDEIKRRHVKRLKDGVCTIELGFILTDILTNLERVSDHCSNIAVCIIEINHSSFDTHGYLNMIKSTNQPEFIDMYKQYGVKYRLPGFVQQR